MTQAACLAWPFRTGTVPDPLPSAEQVGNKAHHLMRMARLGLPVPPGFVLSTELCRRHATGGDSALAGLPDLLREEVRELARVTGRELGSARRPLLLSVRSGAAVSMPGMMETILNVGLNPSSLRGLVRLTGNPRLAADCWRRLVEQYATVVHGCPTEPFALALRAMLARAAVERESDLDFESLEALGADATDAFVQLTGERFPEDPLVQLESAVRAVLRSWEGAKAREYRKLRGIADDMGTAVTVQAMVFGNAGGASGSGVGFTRDPATGARRFYLDFALNAQGEDVVSGRHATGSTDVSMAAIPGLAAELSVLGSRLEAEFHDMQDFEFTVEDGKCWLLQARSGQRTPLASLRIALDLADEGLIEPSVALARIGGIDLAQLEITSLDVPPGEDPLAMAVPASAGVAVGIAMLDPERAIRAVEGGSHVILLRAEPSTDDIKALHACEALLTASGARTSHASVVARQLGKVCLVGCRALTLLPDGRRFRLGAETLSEGMTLSLDGESGAVYRGSLPVRRGRPEELLGRLAALRDRAATPAGSEGGRGA